MMNYQEALAWLDELNTFGIQLGLQRIERLTELLGHPERRYRTVHVTGTNGKGSASAMLAAALSCSGFLYIAASRIVYGAHEDRWARDQ